MRGFLLGVVLVTCVGWCMVQESNRQFRARYRLDELARQESELHKTLEKLQAEESKYRRAANLNQAAKKLKLEQVALREEMPSKPTPTVGVASRLPGQINDTAHHRSEPAASVGMAALDSRRR